MQHVRRWMVACVVRPVAWAPVWLSLLALVVAYLAVLIFPDIDDASPGSLAWYFALPWYLTAAPTPAACDMPRYGLHFIDGLKPGQASVTFQTRASPGELRAAYSRELAGCQSDSKNDGRFECDGAGHGYNAVMLGREPGDGCRHALIVFLIY
jgi:hypothetical protein